MEGAQQKYEMNRKQRTEKVNLRNDAEPSVDADSVEALRQCCEAKPENGYETPTLHERVMNKCEQ